ncbi:MAG: XTP/dITP diphosphatase [Desulfuromonas sp.]|nr:XTP/dITP diphosphatase [Desulfuromonas sp.]
MELIVATQNQGKLKEIRRVLADAGIEVEGMDAFPQLVPAVEDGLTFAENARKKALAIVEQTGKPCLADDSGLEVAALNGRPGVHSARYAGALATDADNNALLLKELAEIDEQQRQAAFCCVMALCTPDGHCRLFEGRLEGRILTEPQGDGGFGYDPLFWVEAFGCSLAEVSLEDKNSISHRGAALRQLLAAIEGR